MLSSDIRAQRLLWRSGLLPALEDVWAANDPAMPEWAQLTFARIGRSLEDIARRNVARFQTRNAQRKQQALARFLDEGTSIPGDIELLA
jgi:hypothetical protein